VRIAIDLSDSLLRKLQAVAASHGVDVNDFILSAIESEIARRENDPIVEVELPLIRSKQPGTLTLTNAEIEDLLT
jgi:hypothetical protein